MVSKTDNIDVLRVGVLTNLFERQLIKNHAYRVPLIGVFLYYVLPLFILIFEKIVKHPTSNTDLLRLYFLDLTHLNFTVIAVCIGLYLGYRFLKYIPIAFHTINQNEVLLIKEQQYLHIISNFQRSIGSKTLKIISTIVFLLTFITFLYIAVYIKPERWWGNINYSFSGIALAMMIAICSHYGIFGFGTILINTKCMKQILEHGIKYRPFHPDGYYGLRPFINILTFEYIILLIGGVSIFSTYYLGYYGLEKTMLIYIAIAGYIIATLYIIIVPLKALVQAINNVKKEKLTILSKEIETIISNPSYKLTKDNAYHLLMLYEQYQFYGKKSTYPYSINILTAAIGTYAVQSILLLKELYIYMKAAS